MDIALAKLAGQTASNIEAATNLQSAIQTAIDNGWLVSYIVVYAPNDRAQQTLIPLSGADSPALLAAIMQIVSGDVDTLNTALTAVESQIVAGKKP